MSEDFIFKLITWRIISEWFVKVQVVLSRNGVIWFRSTIVNKEIFFNAEILN